MVSARLNDGHSLRRVKIRIVRTWMIGRLKAEKKARREGGPEMT
jgi:hypothetical protein